MFIFLVVSSALSRWLVGGPPFAPVAFHICPIVSLSLSLSLSLSQANTESSVPRSVIVVKVRREKRFLVIQKAENANADLEAWENIVEEVKALTQQKH